MMLKGTNIPKMFVKPFGKQNLRRLFTPRLQSTSKNSI